MTAHGLVQSINDEHAKAIASVRRAIDHARRCGQLLLRAKTKCGGHGRWTPWMEKNLRFSVGNERSEIHETRPWLGEGVGSPSKI